MPAIVDGLIEGLGFSNRDAGLVGSFNTYGAAFGAFLVVFYIKRMDRRKSAYALLIGLIVVDFASILIKTPNALIATRFLHGFIGGALVGGLIIGICEALAGAYIEPLGLIGFKDVAPYFVMLIVLFIRPYGLFGTVRIERV